MHGPFAGGSVTPPILAGASLFDDVEPAPLLEGADDGVGMTACAPALDGDEAAAGAPGAGPA